MLTSHSIATVVVNIVLPIVSAIFLVLRFYARQIKHVSLNWSDYLILTAFIFLLGQSIPFAYCAVKGGMGKHFHDLSREEFTVFGKVTFWTQLPYVICVSLVKISIILFYRSIFVVRRFLLACNIMFGIIVAWTIAFFFVSLFQANPISYNWAGSPTGTTIDELGMYTALACTELVLDVATLCMPWIMIWRLHMTTRRKWQLSGIFTLGAFVCVSSAFRIHYFASSKVDFFNGGDLTYDTYDIFIWTTIHPCVGLICACLPFLGPIFQGGRAPSSLLRSVQSYLRLNTTSDRSKTSLRGAWLKDTNSKPGSTYSGPDGRVTIREMNGPPLPLALIPRPSELKSGITKTMDYTTEVTTLSQQHSNELKTDSPFV